MMFEIIYILTFLFSMFYLRNFMIAFLGTPRTTRVLYCLSHLLYPAIVCTLYFTINIPILNLIGNITAIGLISWNYNASYLKRILCCVFIYILMMLADVGVAFATGYMGVSVVEKGTYSQTLGLIIVAIVLYGLSLIAVKIRKHHDEETVSHEEWLAILLIPLMSLFLIIVLVESENITKFRGIMVITVIFVINIIVFHLYERLQESYKNRLAAAVFEQEKEFYYQHCRYMEQSAENARSFRHDTKNHLLSIAELIKSGKSEQAADYIYTLTGDKLNADAVFSDTGNIAIDSVINYKLNEAKANDIQVEADVSVPKNLLLEPSDITAIIGNLMDNAIEAACYLEKSERRITVGINYEKGRLFVEVANTYDGTLIRRNGALISRKQDKTSHGYGLKNVERTLEKYNGCLYHEQEMQMFKVTAMMYVKTVINVSK